MNYKKLSTTLVTLTIVIGLLVPTIFIHSALAADPSDWYMTVDGVLDSDYYALYQYETDKSLTIGFSKFGELINSETNTGLEYGAVDPFAPAAGTAVTPQVPKHMWLQGWFVNITYTHRTQGLRNVWATAMHSDSIEYGNDWIRVDYYDDYSYSHGFEDPRDPGYLIYDSNPYGSIMSHGGRKTNGTAVTAPIEVLYNGPREFIAVCRTTIYDHSIYESNSTTGDIALVELAITIRFDKVKKEVTLLKDVKSLLAWKEGEKMKIEFSNRGEVDLGTETTGYGSYAHFFTEGTSTSEPADNDEDGQLTVYNSSWSLIKSEDPQDTDYPDFSASGPYPQDVDATFDVAQAINSEAGYVWYAAFWPSLNDWSIDGWDNWWHSLKAYDPHYIDYRNSGAEPFIPFYIGEWDFELWHTADSQMRTQFRGVTVYGIVDYHDAVDDSVIDSEVQYYLDEKFNPWDLYSAVHEKNCSRWVEFFSGTGAQTDFTLDKTPLDPATTAAGWEEYRNSSEKVLVNGALQVPDRAVPPLAATTYTYTLSGDTISFSTPPPPGVSNIKVLYSTDDVYEQIDDNLFGPARYEWVVVGRDAQSVDSAGAVFVSASIKQKNMTLGLSGEDIWETDYANQIPYTLSKFGSGSTMADYKDMLGRAALKDDWCTYWPVASSNTAGVGGPVANGLSYYANDFTDAFYGLWDYAGTGYSNKITGITCWNRAWTGTSYNVYDSYDDPTVGYAVISTYKDINGTVVFVIWGNMGRDTYYATQWLHGDAAREINPGILQLQESPRGLTSIILKIDYTDAKHPTFSVPELLGTISETYWEHTYVNIYTGNEMTEIKGGIHDP
jgi:hypothetical protein